MELSPMQITAAERNFYLVRALPIRSQALKMNLRIEAGTFCDMDKISLMNCLIIEFTILVMRLDG
jgi:hypothetical protein